MSGCLASGFRIAIILISGVLSTSVSYAASPDQERRNFYHRVTPDIVTTLTPESSGQPPKTLSIRIDILTDSEENKQLLEIHQALYLDKIILFMNRHKPSDLNSRAKRSSFKWALKSIVNQAMVNETSKTPVKRILFNRVLID